MKLKKLKQPPKTVKELKVQIAIGSLKSSDLFLIAKCKKLEGVVRKLAAEELKSMYPTTKWLNNSLDNSLLA
jgi:hypothetical protein